MRTEGRCNRQGATKSGPRPGNFPLGSGKSRAAARAALDARAAESEESFMVLMSAAQDLALEPDACIEILRECGRLPKGPGGVVDLSKIPDGLNAAETERFLREHGAKL